MRRKGHTHANVGLYTYSFPYPRPFMSCVGALRRCNGTGAVASRFAASSARLYASYARVDFGDSARLATQCARFIRHSGIPTFWHARSVAVAWYAGQSAWCAGDHSGWLTRGKAWLFASPTSSLAITMRRRAIYTGSSPAVSMRASQYNAAPPSLPRTDLWSAEIVSYRASPVRSYRVDTLRRKLATSACSGVVGGHETTSSRSDRAVRASPSLSEAIVALSFAVSWGKGCGDATSVETDDWDDP